MGEDNTDLSGEGEKRNIIEWYGRIGGLGQENFVILWRGRGEEIVVTRFTHLDRIGISEKEIARGEAAATKRPRHNSSQLPLDVNEGGRGLT